MREERFLVFGTGLSGVSACELLIKMKKDVLLYDGNEKLDRTSFRGKHPQLDGIELLLGDELTEGRLSGIEVAVLSPGVPTDLPVVDRMRAAGAAIWGEVELAYRCGQGRVLAITGTNGKTTTTTMLGEIMKAACPDVRVVGNIGIPYTGVAQEIGEGTVVVAELSSFQLETVERFCPQVSAILNITPDHLDRHHTMENYIAAKEAIAKNQDGSMLCVLNYEDEELRRFGQRLSQTEGAAQVAYFSSARPLKQGIYLQGDEILYADGIQARQICRTGELQIIGKHNYENAMAASAMAIGYGVPLDVVRRELLRFQAVEHRIEYVATKRGVRFYNDSKGTNPDAAIQAIRAMQWPTLLIGGGYDKGADYAPWIHEFDGKVKKFVLLGQTKEKIARAATECGFPAEDIILAESLSEAVDACYANARNGDAVLLSPACASWGMFENYEQRGNLFKEMVKGLKE